MELARTKPSEKGWPDCFQEFVGKAAYKMPYKTFIGINGCLPSDFLVGRRLAIVIVMLLVRVDAHVQGLVDTLILLFNLVEDRDHLPRPWRLLVKALLFYNSRTHS